MSDSRRLTVKFALLIAPAVLLSAATGFGSSALRAMSLRLFGPPGLPFEAYGAQFVVPDRTWSDDVSAFYRDYKDLFGRSHPFGPSLTPLNKSLTIIVTTDRRAFENEAKKETDARLEFNGGYFNSNKARIIVEALRPEDARLSLSHELVHAIMHYAHPGASWSPWLSEGVAQWGETRDADKALGTLNLGLIGSARTSVKPGQLKELLGVGHDKFSGADNLRYYQASYALVAFLLEKESGYRDRFLAYFAEEARQGSIDSLGRFREIVGPIDEVEAKWLAWLRQPR